MEKEDVRPSIELCQSQKERTVRTLTIGIMTVGTTKQITPSIQLGIRSCTVYVCWMLEREGLARQKEKKIRLDLRCVRQAKFTSETIDFIQQEERDSANKLIRTIKRIVNAPHTQAR
jgi:hypothetical protein